jgi:hypothetical protein
MLDWGKYITVADRYQHKAKAQDREDLNHTIILSLAQAQARLDNNGGGQLSDVAMLRIASCRVADYWRSEYRNGRIISLNTVIEDEDGNKLELIDTLADDKATDLEAWLECSVWELGYPKRLVEVIRKQLYGIPLTNADMIYLCRFRKREQKTLF